MPIVEDGFPGSTGVSGFPDASIHCTEVKGSTVSDRAANGNSATASEGADESPLQSAEWGGLIRLGAEGCQQEKKDATDPETQETFCH